MMGESGVCPRSAGPWTLGGDVTARAPSWLYECRKSRDFTDSRKELPYIPVR